MSTDETQAPQGAVDDFDDFELALRQRRKRNLVIAGIASAGVIGALAIFLFVFYANQSEPRCDKKVAKDFLRAKEVPGVALYRVCSFPDKMDRALRDMARQQPTTLGTFCQVSGVGEKKLAEYGEIFVKCIQEHLDPSS